MGLYTFLGSLGLRAEDEIIVTGYTCVAVTNVAKYLGVRLKYVDIDERTLNIDTGKLLNALTPSTRAVIVSHNFGRSYTELGYVRRRAPDVVLIEDRAHSSYVREGNGEEGAADASFYSFEYSKPITTGMGGMLVVQNERFLDRVRAQYGMLGKYPSAHNLRILLTLGCHLAAAAGNPARVTSQLFACMRQLGLIAETSQDEIRGKMPSRYPVRLSPVLAYLGYLQMREMEEVNRKKRALARRYHTAVEGVEGVRSCCDGTYVPVRYPLVFAEWVRGAAIVRIKRRIEVEVGCAVGEWFNDVVHPKGSARYGYSPGGCPVGESVSRRIMNLPMGIHVRMQDAELARLRTILVEELGKGA